MTMIFEMIRRKGAGFEVSMNGNVFYVPAGADNHIYRAVVAAVEGGAVVQPEAPPPPAPIPDISFSQLLIGLVGAGWITEAEGNGWLAGTLPPPVLALISALPENQRFAARARALRPSVVVRSDPLVNALAAAQGKTAAEIDAFFVAASAL